ncbi:hypothetical protein K458DRAFT_437389 [Lentithecium fluviatile CBS 122367]|uniref:F-box domain-containing protein n=1 Tax=Lentithecium fluviatile CBS 122367 TaxID=1168545 RepID=A0A6G1IDW6_9PLEO|nr:hypothetical protein K458DRAFT_437389 [Lentithecium fluviatile CBS 122367]
MTLPDHPRGFSSLPTELKTKIFAFMRSLPDRKAVSLVNHQCRAIIAPALFETFMTDLQPTTTKTLDALLHPDSWILPQIRHLHLYVGESLSQTNEKAPEALKLLLSTLPKDQLLAYWSNTRLDSITLGMMLQNHTKMKCLVTTLVYGKGNGSFDITQAAWLQCRLRELEGLALWVDDVPASYATFRFFLNNAPKLEYLDIQPDFKGCLDFQALLSGPESPPRLSTIRRLDLWKVDFSKAPAALAEHLDVLKLNTLALSGCRGVAPFLRCLAARFSASEGRGSSPALTTLELNVSSAFAKDAMPAIEALLQSFRGLEWLWIANLGLLLPDKKCFAQHKQSLRYLGVESGNLWNMSYYSSVDMKYILASCKRLETLAIQLPPIQLGHLHGLGDEFRLRSPTSAYVKTEIETIFEIIASHPKLRALRLLEMPAIDYTGYAQNGPDSAVPIKPITEAAIPLVRATMQHFASEVMQYLSSHGSHLKILIVGNYVVPQHLQSVCRDLDGQIWPWYKYIRGRTTDLQGGERIVAVPAPDAESELPDRMAYFQW